jgi:hypothetical protein
MGSIRISLRIGRPLVLVIVLAIVAASVAQASPSVAKVTGSYSYTSFSGPKTVSLSAHGTTPVKGTWSFRGGAATIGGPITCLVVDGSEAWLAGTQSVGEDGVFIYLIDGGSPGTEDLAVTWVQDPDQSFDDLQGWCESRFTDVPLFELDSGNLTVRSGS